MVIGRNKYHQRIKLTFLMITGTVSNITSNQSKNFDFKFSILRSTYHRLLTNQKELWNAQHCFVKIDKCKNSPPAV